MSSNSTVHPVLINGVWQEADAEATFVATNPSTREPLGDSYPVSSWTDVDNALTAAAGAFRELRNISPQAICDFLSKYADLIEQRADEIAATAHRETGLPVEPRLKNVELPRTTNQLRLAANAATDTSWRMQIADPEANLHSVLEPLGPVAIFGPNNFPLAFNGISGGDFAAAIAAGCPVIAKAHGHHPTTSRLLAEAALEAASDLPSGTVQMLYGMSNENGFRFVADSRLGAAAFTGSQSAGLALKRAADEVGKPFYAELSAINPVVILPGALEERLDAIVDETVTSGLMGAGQFCTNPGLLITIQGDSTNKFIESLSQRYSEAPCGTLFSEGVLQGLSEAVTSLIGSGAEVITGASPADQASFAYQNTVLVVSGDKFISSSTELQREAFGNCSMVVVCADMTELEQLLHKIEGSLTGCIYSATDGSEDSAYDTIAPELTLRVGRLLNDKMPTGVAVSPAMNHGGPFPAAGHPHFTAVGLPAACRRFTRLVCYDNVRPHRLPSALG